MTRAGGKRAALAAILLAIALGFGGALTNLQPTEARADAAPGASTAAPNASAPLTAAIPGGAGAAPGAGGGAEASGRVAPGPAQPNPLSGAAQTTVDYDDDDDGLIDVTTLAQLNAIRHDLNGNGDATHADYVAAFPNRITAAGTRMGCPSGTCTGYELRADLDFDTDGDGDVDSSDSPSYANWDPIGSSSSKYTAELKGNNHTISNLTITSTTNAHIGLISTLSTSGEVSGVGMRDANLSIAALPNNSRVGALVGYNEGDVRSSYSTGTFTLTVAGGGANIGGLVGMMELGGKIEASWSSADITASGPSLRVGGLVGQLGWTTRHGHVTACYATGDVSATGNFARASGLVGWTLTGGSRVTASYSTGAATASGTSSAANPLTGSGHTLSIVTSNSYWDTETSSIADDADSDSPEGETSANLKSPTGYTGIYANWNVNVDGAAGNDDPWDFGTSSHYPRLKFDNMDLMAQLRDYDLDDDGLAEIYNLDQLNAVRWDLDGTGAHDSGTSAANQKKYKTAFFNADESLGCPDTADAGSDPGPCIGYELMNDLNFDTDGSGTVDSSDDYPNWTPVGVSTSYSGEFKGNNNTISNLTVSVTSSSGYEAGLFGNASGTITGVGLADASISHAATGGTNIRTGALVGSLSGTVRSSWSTGSVSSSSARANTYVGGLVGAVLDGTVTSSWSAADASVSAGTTSSQVGGLVGALENDTATTTASIIASYAAGSASNTATAGTRRAGGLAGLVDSATAGNYAITASFTTAIVESTNIEGAFTGSIAASSTGTITASYWDVSKTAIEDDANTTAPEGKTSLELTTPTAYGTQSTDIYMGWNVNVDGSAGADDPWDFGDAAQYPRLKFDGMDLSAQVIAPVVDYDSDDDNLIDITTLAQLNAVRHDLDGDGDPVSTGAADYAAAFPNRDISASGRMGCIDASSPTDNTADCGGYELMANLDFDTDDSGTIDSSDDYPNWNPIGGTTVTGYSGEFKGNNRTISNLTITNNTGNAAGLFSNASGVVTGVGLPDANVSSAATTGSSSYTGALVGSLTGTVRSSWATGSVSSSSAIATNYVGGLVGGVTEGTIAASWADVSASVSAGTTASHVGGLTGALENFSSGNTASVIASYAAGAVSNTASAGNRNAGGLIGYIDSSSGGSYAVTASYAGALTSSAQPANAHPFNGPIAASSTGTITASYWDISKTGVQDDADNDAPEGKTAAELTTPTAYGTQATDIYMSWNVNVDGAAGNDDPWDFGDANQYPKLKFGGMSLSAQTIAPPTDYDSDDDNLIDVRTLGQLNAIRYDPDGNGVVAAGSDTTAYEAAGAYPNRAIGMGCAATCAGYELMNDLDFDTDGSGVVDASDSPSFPNWSPMGTSSSTAYRTEFKGNNRTISNLTMTGYSAIRYYGLFGRLRQGAAISGLGMKDANIDLATLPSAGTMYVGSIAGYTEGAATIRSSYSTGLVKIAPPPAATAIGGLAGYMVNGGIYASWSSADVVVTAVAADASAGGLVGDLLSDGAGNVAQIIASYSTGAVSNSATTAVNNTGGLSGGAYATTGATVWDITASYAAGPVSGTGDVGGLVGNSQSNITDSYWDTDLTGIADDADNSAPEGVTARQLQQPRPYSGIFRDWNVSVDGDGDNDDPWEFGTGMQYPMLKYGGMSLPAQGSLAMGAPNVDTNGETPTVGRMARVCLTTGPVLRAPRPGSPSLPARWQWQRSADLLTWTDIAEDGGGTYEYTPVAADVNNYLRACVAIRSSDARSRGESEMCTRPFPAAQSN